jgi:lipoprotein signal peptidase
MGARVAMPVFAAAFAADLLSKMWVVQNSQDIVFNVRANDLLRRVAMSAVAIMVAVVLTRLARWRGLGRMWGLWVGCALLVAGVLANGVSPFLWSSGVPDFIHLSGGWVWNVADFEIAVGMTGGILSIAVAAGFVYAREALARQRHQDDSAAGL